MFSAVVSWQLWCGDAVTIIRSPSPSSQNINWFWEVHFRDTRVRVQSSDEVSECLLEDNELGEDYIWKNNLNTFEATFILFHYIFSNRRQKIETGNILILSHSEEGQIDAFGSFCEGCFNCYLADRQIRKAVFVPLCFLLFSWLILIRKMTSGGVLESSGSPLVDGHRDFQNRCRNGWENWSWSWEPSFGKWQKGRKLISVLKVPTSTSIFSAISASIFKILVPIIKRISWGFRNTPKHQLSDEYWPRKWQKTKWHKNCFSKLNKTPILGDLPFSLNCCNLA